jgi:hypothetical protein
MTNYTHDMGRMAQHFAAVNDAQLSADQRADQRASWRTIITVIAVGATICIGLCVSAAEGSDPVSRVAAYQLEQGQ